MTTKTLDLHRPAESVRRLFEAALDYAGLFPPAALPIEAAVEEYAADCSGPFAWMVGRFVAPVSRLEELSPALASGPSPRSREAPWRVSAIAGPAVEADIEAILAFNARPASAGRKRQATIDSIEVKLARPEEISPAARLIPPQLAAVFEVPLSEAMPDWLAAVRESQAAAKVRTGGLQPEQFPAPAALARFLALAVRWNVPFKATAGLHHALRGSYALAGGASVEMHGFLNLLLAAALTRAGIDEQEATRLLEEQNPRMFQLGTDGARWGAHRLTLSQVAEARGRTIRSWGSCSFTEPREDLLALHWL